MSEITRWDPLQEMRQMRRLMNRLSLPWMPTMREDIELSGLDETLPVDIFEKDNAIVVRAALPGVDPKDIKVDVTDGVLHISAETKSEDKVDEANYHRREYHYGKMSRSFRLPNNVDTNKVEAKFDNGMLRLQIPHSTKMASKSIKVDVK